MVFTSTRRLDSNDYVRRTRDVETKPEKKPETKPTPRPTKPVTPDLTPNGSRSSSRTRRGDLDLRQQQIRSKLTESSSSSDNGAAAGGANGQGSFTERVLARFADWDKNGDRFLSASEIDAAMLDPNNTGDDAAALGTLKKRYEALEQLSDDEIGAENDGVSDKDMLEYKTQSLTKRDDTTENWFGTYKGKIDGSSRELFANGLPDWQSIKQGSTGDCWVISAIAAKAKLDPEAVKNMIKDNGDGTYTVTFPGKKPITVQRPTDAELGYYATTGKDGLWGAILEKAAGQARSKSNWLWNTKLPQDEIGDGGPVDDGLDLIGKGSADYDWLVATRMNTTRSKLDAAFRENRMVTAGIGPGLKKTEDETLPTRHAYSIIGWDRTTDTVTVRNPWGRRELRGADGKPLDGTDDGVFKMSLADFYKNFTGIAYEGK